MNIEDFSEYCMAMEGVTEKTPFGKFASRFDSILVFYVSGHIFCMVDMNDFTSVTMKLPPDVIATIREHYSSCEDPFNSDPHYWIQLNLRGDIPDNLILRYVAQAYETVKAKYSKKSK